MVANGILMWSVIPLVAIISQIVKAHNIYNLHGRPGEGYIISVSVGTPYQSFNMVIDTGSTNFAIAGAPHANIEKYFNKSGSYTYEDLEEDVSLVYTQGRWSGELGHDVVYFPKLNSVPPVACDIALITDSEDFYMNGSDWQGILGLAYSTIAKPTPSVKSWIDFLQKKSKDKTIAFSLKLCGPKVVGENQHYGSFEILNNVMHPVDGLFTASIVREWFYEIVLTNIYVNNMTVAVDCQSLNTPQTIVDSGTTNLRLPRNVFDELVKILMTFPASLQITDEVIPPKNNKSGKYHEVLVGEMLNIAEKFWTEQQMACWSKPQNWSVMPTISIEIASGPYEYFRIDLPGVSYIREVFANQEASTCYKFAVEPSDTGTILGVIALEGFRVIFNRTERTVGFMKSDCGPNVAVTGPFFADENDDTLFDKCWHKTAGISLLNIAAYIVCVALMLGSCIFVYIFVQWLKNKYFRHRMCGAIVSMSHTSLINEDS